MNPIDQLFQRLRSQGKKAFIPFITAGDPDLKTTESLIPKLAESGASLIEIGFPYSDPIADGAVIQASYTRALENGLRIDDIFKTALWLTQCPSPSISTAKESEVRCERCGDRMVLRVGRRGKFLGCASYPACKNSIPFSSDLETPLVAMVSFSLVQHRGSEKFVHQAQEAGFSGAIVPDLPVEESADLARLARDRDFKLIQLVTPTTPRDRAVQIAKTSTGFLYCVSVTGITGERDKLPEELLRQLAWLKGQTELPLCVGFGISRPEHVRMLRDVADGVIVGSALVRKLEQAKSRPMEEVVQDICELVRTLSSALD
jgi:tryptophan synthase alpha chain